MRERPVRWWPLWVVAVLVAAVGGLLYAVWQSKNQTNLAIYGAFAVPMIVLAAGWITWAWRQVRANTADDVAGEDELDRAAGRLATAVQAQWEAEAAQRGLTGADPIKVSWGRPTQPVAGPAAAAISSRRFEPLPGLAPAEEIRLAVGDLRDLHALYGGLGSGRLVIVGPPGSGKTGAAVLLILAALRHRAQVPADDRAKIPVPVLVTAHGWDPRRQPVAVWLTRRLQDTYPLFAGRSGAAIATALLAAGKLAVIIDGLDEIADDLRSAALQALDQQATSRIVILSRTAEIATAASRQGVLRGAAGIELRPVSPAEAARYLERVQLDPPPAGWRSLIARLRSDPHGSLARALGNPLALTLVRDTYHVEDDVQELIDFSDAISPVASADQAALDVTDHLLDRVLPAAYAPQPGQPQRRYDLPTARRALTKIATRMNHDHTRDLMWWHIPGRARVVPRGLRLGLVVVLVVGFGFGLWFGIEEGWAGGLGAGVGAGLWLGLPFGLVSGLVNQWVRPRRSPPRRPGRLQLKMVFNRTNLVAGLVAGLVLGLVVGLVSGFAAMEVGTVTGLAAGFVFGLGVALVAGLVIGLVFVLTVGLVASDDTSSLSPAASWRADRNYGLLFGLVFGLVAVLVSGLVSGLLAGNNGLVTGLEAGPVYGLVFGLVSGPPQSHAVSESLAAAQLAVQWRTPLRLMRFLNDACSKNVLRTVGPVYQFRHARLQDQLAAAAAPRITAAEGIANPEQARS